MKRTLRTILIDDEPLAIKRLQKLLMPFGDEIEIVASATNGEDAIKVIDSLKPDVIFLDIQMPVLTGFEVLERITHQPIVIFSTAYDEYALKAFEANSIDYLLKPVDSRRLEKAIKKLKNITDDGMDQFGERMKSLLNSIPSISKRIQVKTGDRIRLLEPGQVYFIQADEKYTRLNTFDKSYLVDTPLSQMEKDLDDNFIRVHRGVIINLEHIEEIIRMFKGTYKVKMKDREQTELPVSRQSKYKLGL